ncbi:MAG: YihY/virulence factor BrkB family protein [Paracoccaceae bacterium]
MDLTPSILWRFSKELFVEVNKDRVGLTAAGIAFYGLLSLFPGIAAMMALGALWTQPSVLVSQMQQIGSVLPPEASKIIIDQAVQIAGSQKGGLGLAAVVGIVLSIYSASNAVGSLFVGIHLAAGEPDSRGFIASTVFTLAMTVVTIGLALLAIFSTVVVPALLAALHAQGWVAWILGLVRWPIMGVIAALGLSVFYRLSIQRRSPPPPWITPGAVLGAILWLGGSVAFSIYVQNFANYNKTFGTLGGVISLLIWLWLSAYIVLLGEEVNALLESSAIRQRDQLVRKK